MRNAILLKGTTGTETVELYNWQSASPFYSTKVGDFTFDANEIWYIDLTDQVIGTVLVDSLVSVPFIKHSFAGDDGHVPDGTVTPDKTTFAQDW
ncbi:MAG: hypothetical protein ACE5IR_16195 [bacterium]